MIAMPPTPYVLDVTETRRFACFPASVLAFVVNREEQVLLLSHPRRAGYWEVVNGALEAGEKILDGVLREVREELGGGVEIRPLGAIHVFTFKYDRNVTDMISICYLLEYKGGEIVPGSDMAGSVYSWCTLDAVCANDFQLLVPKDQKWLVERALTLYRMWRYEDVKLEPNYPASMMNKHEMFDGPEGKQR